MDANYYVIKEDLGLIPTCGHGSDFDHDTENVFNDLRPKSKHGYQYTIEKESTEKFKKQQRANKVKLNQKTQEFTKQNMPSSQPISTSQN